MCNEKTGHGRKICDHASLCRAFILLSLRLHRRVFRKLVAAFVERVAGVAFDPVEKDGVRLIEFVELHPERLVEDGVNSYHTSGSFDVVIVLVPTISMP